MVHFLQIQHLTSKIAFQSKSRTWIIKTIKKRLTNK